MKTPEEIFNILKEKFDDAVIELFADEPVDPIIQIDPLKIKDVSLFLRDSEELEFDALMLLSGVDDFNGEKITAEDGAVTELGRTMSVYYHLDSTKIGNKIVLRVSVPFETPKLESVESVWKTAHWHEREAFDMYGFEFHDHPDLIRILMPYDWEEGSHPLRKDYKSPEFYQGMKIPY